LTNNTKAHLGLIGTNVFFAINLSAVKYLTGNNYTLPFGLNLVRVGVSVILFWVLFFFNKERSNAIKKADLPRLVLCALSGVAINQMLFVKGLSLTYSIHAVLLMLTTPILITIIAALVIKEKITAYKIVGLLMGVSGAVLLILSRQNSGLATNVFLGDGLIIINAISYSCYFILVKPLMAKYNPITVIRWVFTFGLVMIIPFGFSEFTQIQWHTINATGYICLFLVVIGGTFLAYLFNIYGIKILGASTAGAYIYSQPIFATIIAMAFLHEALEWYKIIAALLIFTGVYLCNKQALPVKK
jgi:drug/metabolite transporter (DMT)-like permease